MEGLGKSTTELLGGVWGGLGGLVGIAGKGDGNSQGASAVKSRIATIEHVESSLDTRTREAVKVLILKGRTDKQVVNHYTIAERGVTEQQVQAVRSALAIEQSLAKDGDSGPQAGPGVQVRNERPYCVVAILPGSPADLSGKIQMGDVLVSVQGQEVDFKTPDEVRSLMKGPEGSIIGLRFTRSTSRASGGSSLAEAGESYAVTLQRALLRPADDATSAVAAGEHSVGRAQEPSVQLHVGKTKATSATPHDDGDARAMGGGQAQGRLPSGDSGAGTAASLRPPAGLGFTFQRDASARYWVVRRLKENGFAQVFECVPAASIAAWLARACACACAFPAGAVRVVCALTRRKCRRQG